MRTKIWLLGFAITILILSLSSIQDVEAQTISGITAQLFIQPFPSPYVSDWQTSPSIGTLTIHNGTGNPEQVFVTLVVSTSAGAKVISGTSSVILLPTGATTVLNNTDILSGNLTYYNSGTKSQIVQTGRIPEGMYTACVSITGADGVPLVSNECSNFTIIYPNPPQLVYPFDGDSVTTTYPVLQWTPVQVPVQYQVHYVLTMVQMLQGQTPLQALSADVPQYTNNDLMTTTLQYPLSALPLVAGNTYVWQVQVLDQNGFPPATNNGKSQIWTFKYQQSLPAFIYHPKHLPPPSPPPPPANKPIFTTTTISGTMYGTFSLPQKSYQGYQGMGYHKPQYGNFGSGNSGGQPGPQPTPLADATLILRDEFVFIQPYNPSTRTLQESIASGYENMGVPVASTTTDANGNFAFNFAQTQPSPDTLSTDYQETSPDGRELTGTLVEMYRITVQDPYYCSPDNDIAVQSGQTDNVGSLYALARSYSLNVTLSPPAIGISPQQLSGLYVVLLRQSRPIGVPNNEGYTAPSVSDSASNSFINENLPGVQNMQVVAEATADQNGQATFSDLMENMGPNDQYFVCAIPGPNSSWNFFVNYTAFQFGNDEAPTQYPNYQVTPAGWRDQAVFNSEYTSPTVSITQAMTLGQTEIEGRVVRSDNQNQGVSGATLTTLPMSDPPGKIIKYAGFYGFHTLSDGSFVIPVTSGLIYKLAVTDYGYDSTLVNVNGGGLLDSGQIANLGTIRLQPGLMVFGKVVDEKGNPIEANVMLNGGNYAVATPAEWPMVGGEPQTGGSAGKNGAPLYQVGGPSPEVGGQSTGGNGQGQNNYNQNHNGGNGKSQNNNTKNSSTQTPPTISLFITPAVPGQQQIIIDPTPYDNTLFPDTETVNISPEPWLGNNPVPIGTFTLIKKYRRIKVVVKSGLNGMPLDSAHVNIQNVGDLLTNSAGVADTAFYSSGSSYDITVTAPDGKDFVAQSRSCLVPETKDWTVLRFRLQAATHIYGRVYAGTGSVPVPGADVFLAQSLSSSLLQVRTKTNRRGYFTLHDVPFGRVRIDAAKSQSDLVGADTALSIARIGLNKGKGGTSYKASISNVNLHLRIFEGMDITQLLGFPMEVTSLTENGSIVTISGNITRVPSNNTFALAPSDSQLLISFTNVAIDSGSQKDSLGLPYAVPERLPLVTDLNSIQLKLYGSLDAVQKNNAKGLAIDAFDSGGEVVDPTYISPVNFSLSSVGLPNIYLELSSATGGAGRLSIPTITSSGKAPPFSSGGYYVSDSSGHSLRYILNSLVAVADSSVSKVNGDSLILATTIHTDLGGIKSPYNDIDLNVGDVVLHKNSVNAVSGRGGVKIDIDNWVIDGLKWSFAGGGMIIDSGFVQTQLGNISFANMEVDSNQLKYPTFQSQTILLGGVLPLAVNSFVQWDFGIDSSSGHWALSVAPHLGANYGAAYINGLPGTSDQISIDNFSVTSDGKEEFTPSNNARPLTLYQVASYTPSQLNVMPGKVEVTGSMDLHLPLVPGQTCVLDYSKSNGALVFQYSKFPITFGVDTVVNVSFPTDSSNLWALDSSGFHATGTVSENGLFSFNVRLYRTTDSTSIWALPGQTFKVSADGKTYLADVNGWMEDQQGSWTPFTFSGNLTGVNNANGSVVMVAYGDLIGTGGKITIKNLSSPIGDITMGYDPKTNQIYGSVNIDIDLTGGNMLKGSATMSISSNNQWLFTVGGELDWQSPKITITVGFILGVGAVDDNVKSVLQDYSWYYENFDSLPPDLPSAISGFFFEGSATMPIPGIPQASLSFGPVQVTLAALMGGDLTLAMTFNSDTGNTYAAGVIVFAEVQAVVSLEFHVVCASVSAELLAYVDLSGMYHNSSDWYVDGKTGLELRGSASAGIGPSCNNTCSGGGGCTIVSQSATLGFGVEGHYGTDYKSVNFYFGASPY